jgi:hypothetical protein
MRTPSERYLTAEEAVVALAFPSLSAFYEFTRRRKYAFQDGGAIVKRGRCLLVDPVAYTAVLRDLQAGRTRLRRVV